MSDSLSKIDTSFWLLNSPEWMLTREDKWQEIEHMLQIYKPKKKCLTPVKNYYLKGKMPNWKSLKVWEDSDRHLDIFLFLWLHPSDDIKVLKQLRDEYFGSTLILQRDLSVGYSSFLDSQITMASSRFPTLRRQPGLKIPQYPYLEGKGEVLFKVLMESWEENSHELLGQTDLGKKQVFNYPKAQMSYIADMGKWLALEELLPLNKDFLFQYDFALAWWYQSVKDCDYYNNSDFARQELPHHEKALYRIYAFDKEREGDPLRLSFAGKIRRILDEGDFKSSELKEVWGKIKTGKTIIAKAWN